MTLYYTLLQSRTHALILGNKFALENIPYELTYIPRELSRDLCNLGVRFTENYYPQAITVIRRSGLPSCKLYREYVSPEGNSYQEIDF
jgi:hypothetical protein